jgi:transposase
VARGLETRNGTNAWSMKDVEDADRLRVAALLETGMTVREIAEEIGIGKSGVHRMKQRIEREAKEEAGQGRIAGQRRFPAVPSV